MIIIRKKQFDEMYGKIIYERVGNMIPGVCRRLQNIDLLPDPLPETTAPIAPSKTYSLDDKEVPLNDTLFEAIKLALDHDFRTIDGITQFVSYGIMVSPTWFERDRVKAVLGNLQESEYDRLMKIHSLL